MTRRAARYPLVLVAFSFSLAALSGCAGVSGVEEQRVYQLPDGIATVDTTTTVATVSAVDAAKRTVTLATPDGKTSRHKTGKDFDLGSLRVGEQISVRVTEEVIIEVRNDGTPATEGAAVRVAAITDGQAGAMLESEAVESSARVVAVDAGKRKATLQFADGTTRTLKTGKHSALVVGETVIVQYALSVLIATTN
jgi:hypothetical protein